MRLTVAALAAFAVLGWPSPARSAKPAPEPQTIVVTAPGDHHERDESLGIDAAAIRSSGRPDLLQALSRLIPGVSLQDAQNNPFQPNLIYRGFTVSPLQGQAQGLAVYLDGGRFNQPFGDTVQFDLLPEAAILRADLLDANPVYGLNALGGALIIETKTGRSAPGVFVSAGAGRFGESELTGEAGWKGNRASAYVAIQRTRDAGWRRFSPSALVNGFADLGWDGARGGLHVKLLGADSDLTGNGSAPIELLEADWRAVFTHPDRTRNRYGRVSLHPWLSLSRSLTAEATVYHQQLRQRTLNGDAADIEVCEEDAGLLCLETGEEEDSVLRDRAGNVVADRLSGGAYGVLNRSRTRSTSSGILVQLVGRDRLLGRPSTLVFGFSYDLGRTRFDSSSELGSLTTARSVEGLGPVIAQPDGSITPVSLTSRTRYAGVFLSERLSLSDTFTAEAVLRWNEARIRLDDKLGTALDGSHRFRRLNPGLELEWRPVRELTLRAGYAESNRAPTPAELACADESAPCSLTNFFIADPPLRQVVARSFELGGSGRSGMIDWLVTAYRSTNADDIQFVASSIRGRAFFRNIGETRRQGLEATLAYRNAGLTLRGGYAFTDATYRTALLLNSPDNPGADEKGQIAVSPGDRLAGIPAHRALLSADFAGGGWSLGGDLQAASGQYFFGDEANLRSRTRPFAIIGLRGSVRLHGPLHLFGEVRNVLNQRHATFAAFSATDEIEMREAPGASDPRSLGPGAPRRWLAGVKVNF